MLKFCVLAAFLGFVDAHGKLTTPTPRPYTGGYQDDPVNGPDGDEFVCQNEYVAEVDLLDVTAGSTLDLGWTFGAAHVGDCALYMSYDFDSTRADMQWFKIANLPDCNIDNSQTATVNLPDWLPAGQAVLRWDWYALHVYPTVEFYANCVDINVISSSSTAPGDINTYVIPGQYPASGDQDNDMYWNPFTNTIWKQEGPTCAGDITGNCCDVSGYARTGFINSDCAQSGTSPETSNPGSGNDSGDDSGADTDESSACVTSSSTTTTVTYVVQEGDTLSSIADQYEDVTWEEICEINELSDCNILTVGQELIISTTTNPGQGCTSIDDAYARSVSVALMMIMADRKSVV